MIIISLIKLLPIQLIRDGFSTFLFFQEFPSLRGESISSIDFEKLRQHVAAAEDQCI